MQTHCIDRPITERLLRMLQKLVFAIPLLCSLFACGSGGGGEAPPTQATPAPAAPLPSSLGAILPIAPVIQLASQWCWAASSQMVFAHYDYPFLNTANPQCGIVAMTFGGQCLTDCRTCDTAIGPIANLGQDIDGYGTAISAYLPAVYPSLFSTIAYRPLSMTEIQAEISGNRPIVIGIAPTGGVAMEGLSQHIAVIVGYDIVSGRNYVVVNDPFPYTQDSSNPYLSAGGTLIEIGQYKLPYVALVQDLHWANSIYQIVYQQPYQANG